MTPAEHYREAERWLDRAEIGGTSYAQAEALARAQVHATLATAPKPVRNPNERHTREKP